MLNTNQLINQSNTDKEKQVNDKVNLGAWLVFLALQEEGSLSGHVCLDTESRFSRIYIY